MNSNKSLKSQHQPSITIKHWVAWNSKNRATTCELHSEPRHLIVWLRTMELAPELQRSGSSRPSNKQVQNVTSCSDLSLFTTIWTHSQLWISTNSKLHCNSPTPPFVFLVVISTWRCWSESTYVIKQNKSNISTRKTKVSETENSRIELVYIRRWVTGI